MITTRIYIKTIILAESIVTFIEMFKIKLWYLSLRNNQRMGIFFRFDTNIYIYISTINNRNYKRY